MTPRPLPQRNLSRLEEDAYRGLAWVHWTLTIAGRRTGWLTESLHAEFRLLLLHTSSRYSLVCPVYCLMPDHLHLLCLGISSSSDQKLAMRFLRKFLNRELGDYPLQHQSFEHVLQGRERKNAAFENAALYICTNPVRAGLATHWTAWPYSGCMIPGYPDLSPSSDTFWPTFWRIHHRLTDPEVQSAASRENTEWSRFMQRTSRK